MLSRIAPALAAVLLFTSVGSAQTVRFDTNVGNFDMILNPDSDANLQVLVDNMLAYVEGGLYDNTVINRAVDGDDNDPSNDFVLQMGSFLIDSIFPAATADEFTANAIERFDPVIVDANGDGQVDFNAITNGRGTVSLALSGPPNTGTSSFFINLGDNSGLDSQGFVPFARIEDMSTVDLIMQLNNVDVYSQPGNLTLKDIPLIDNGSLVFIERAFVLEGLPVAASAGLNTENVPEPPTLVLAVGALMLISVLSRHKNM